MSMFHTVLLREVFTFVYAPQADSDTPLALARPPRTSDQGWAQASLLSPDDGVSSTSLPKLIFTVDGPNGLT